MVTWDPQRKKWCRFHKHASFIPATLSGLGNVSSLSMWLGQQRSCIFANADRLPTLFTALLLVLILPLPRLRTCHQPPIDPTIVPTNICACISQEESGRGPRPCMDFVLTRSDDLARTYTQARMPSNIPRFFKFTHSSGDQPQKYMWRRVSNLLNTFTLQNSHIQWQTSSSQATGCTDRPTNISGYVTGRDSSPARALLICRSITSPMHPGYLQPTEHTVELASAGAANTI